MRVCPSCLSLESATYCVHCGTRIDSPNNPLFWCTLGWSRSKEYESILRQFQAENGYRCVETVEEILHQVPLFDITATESFIRRFARAMLWKETRFETKSGIIFDLHSLVGNCFLRRVTAAATPCLQETPSCPFLGDLQSPETSITGAVQLAASLLQHPEVQCCPYARRLTETAFYAFCTDDQAPFAVAAARRGLENGSIVLTQHGAFTPRTQGAVPWPTRLCPDIPSNATWAACSGHLQLAVVEDQLRMYPSGNKVAPWLSASLVAPTLDGRHVGIPAPHAADPFFLVFDELGNSLSCGPFPLPFALDFRLQHVAFAYSREQSDCTVTFAAFVGNVNEPFWLQMSSWVLPEPVRQLVCETETVAALTDNDTVWYFDTSKKKEHRHFPKCLQITFLENKTLAILWQNGWQLTFWNTASIQDFSLLIPAKRIFPTQDGNVVAVASGRITEINTNGVVVDFRCAEALWMSRRGYMEQTPNGYVWHILDDAPIHGDFWKNTPTTFWLVSPTKDVHICRDEPLYPLVTEVISYFLSTLPTPLEGTLTHLIQSAPKHVHQEFQQLLQRYPWIRAFDGPVENWPMIVQQIEDFQNIQ